MIIMIFKRDSNGRDNASITRKARACHVERVSRSPEHSEGETSAADRQRSFAALRMTSHDRFWSLKFIKKEDFDEPAHYQWPYCDSNR